MTAEHEPLTIGVAVGRYLWEVAALRWEPLPRP
jgi:hypothetical protein